jgi:hypothetical protein
MAEGRKAWRLTEVAIRETLSPVERLEMMPHPWVSFAIMPLFAFANAGMPLSVADLGSSVTFAVFVGFTIGKPVGILTFRVAYGAFGPCESSSGHGLGNARRGWSTRRYRLHDGAVHGQAGHLVSIGSFCGGRSGSAGMVDDG